MRKIIAIALTRAMCLGVLAGCCLSHEWKEATCEEAAVCIECGKTEGEALGHAWTEADCENPATCSVCGETEGEALGHTWEEDVCTVCGKAKDTVICRDDYTAVEAELKKNAANVVATMGDRELTNALLQVYYCDSITTYYSQNYYYLPYMGVDPTLPMNQNPFFGDATMTWEQYFLDAAVEQWSSYNAVDMMAQADGFAPSQELLDRLEQTAAQLDAVAQLYGYENAEAYLADAVAPGVSVDDFVFYNSLGQRVGEYVQYFYEANQPTDEEIAAYAAENAALLAENGITEDMGMMSSVRHILVTPQGGTTDESGLVTYSDEEWAAAEAEAERILQEWKAGEATEESFAALVPVYSEDGGSLETGGLYENVCDDGTYVAAFTAWAVDPARQVGDTGIVKTEYGYHIMYYVCGSDYFTYAVSQNMMAELFQQRLEATLQENPVDTDYRAIWLVEKAFTG